MTSSAEHQTEWKSTRLLRSAFVLSCVLSLLFALNGSRDLVGFSEADSSGSSTEFWSQTHSGNVLPVGIANVADADDDQKAPSSVELLDSNSPQAHTGSLRSAVGSHLANLPQIRAPPELIHL